MDEFTLRVTFTGLNLFVQHEDKHHVGVLQPDCLLPGEDKLLHEDETTGIPHVGFIAFDLSNLVASYEKDVLDGQAVYRFKNHVLDFGQAEDLPVTIDKVFELPDFTKIAPILRFPRDSFSARPKIMPLMQTMLSGGTIKASGKRTRTMPQVLNQPAAEYKQPFANQVSWERQVTGTQLTIRIRNFARTETLAQFTLKPSSDGVLSLTVANVCSENPLAWSDYGVDQVAKDDEDFKWLYRLLLPPVSKKYKDVLLGNAFPIPRLVRDGSAGVENCIGGILREQEFDLPTTKEGE